MIINKLFVLILTLLSVFMLFTTIMSGTSIGFVFLPIPAYLISELVTNSKDFEITKHKKAAIFYIGILLILILITLYKII